MGLARLGQINFGLVFCVRLKPDQRCSNRVSTTRRPITKQATLGQAFALWGSIERWVTPPIYMWQRQVIKCEEQDTIKRSQNKFAISWNVVFWSGGVLPEVPCGSGHGQCPIYLIHTSGPQVWWSDKLTVWIEGLV